MDLIQEAIDRATPVNGSRFVTLSMLPSVAAKWLAPRLGRFIEQHPEIDLRVTASRHFVDFHAEEVDAAVRYGKGNWPGLTTELLATETVIPVCTPDYAALIGLNDPNDLRRATLLKSDLEENWDAWFKAAGLSAEPAIRGPKLGDDTATLQAVLDSQGVCLGRSILIAEDLRAGRLIAPFALRLNAAFSYWFVMPSSATSNADIASVRDWLANEFSVAVC
jgi:LysR family glycine cleavage system transcriptional activator